MSMYDTDTLAALFVMFFMFFAVISFILYILMSYGLYKMGKNENIELSWFAFLPFGNYYVMGKLTKGNFTVFGSKIESPELFLPLGIVILYFLSFIPYIGMIFTIIGSFVLEMFVYYHIYKKYKGQDAVLFTALSMIFPIIVPFVFFGMRNAVPVDDSYKEII